MSQEMSDQAGYEIFPNGPTVYDSRQNYLETRDAIWAEDENEEAIYGALIGCVKLVIAKAVDITDDEAEKLLDKPFGLLVAGSDKEHSLRDYLILRIALFDMEVGFRTEERLSRLLGFDSGQLDRTPRELFGLIVADPEAPENAIQTEQNHDS